MSEKATIKNTETSFGSLLQQAQQQETQQVSASTVVETTPTVETSSTTVSPSGELQNNETVPNQEAATQQQQEQPQPAQEANESSFNIAFEDEPQTQPQSNQPQQQPQFNWKEEIKKLDRKEILKEVGISDFAVEIDEHLQRGGQPIDYLNAKAINWDNVSDLDILKAELKTKYPTLEPSDLDYLFNRKYGINDFDDDDIKREKLINQKVDAAEIRSKKKEQQAKFKLPEPIQVQQQQQPQQNNEEEIRRYSEIQQLFVNHEATKNLSQNKRVAIDLGEGVKPFNFKIDKPELLMQPIFNSEKWRRIMAINPREPDVSKLIPDVAKYQRVMLAAMNPNYEKDLFNYGKSFGHRKELDEGHNAQLPTGKSVIPNGKSEKETWQTSAKEGTLGSHFRR